MRITSWPSLLLQRGDPRAERPPDRRDLRGHAAVGQDLSQFADLQGNLGLLAGLLLVTWTLAAFGEELAYRGFILSRITDVLGPSLVVVAVGMSSGPVRAGPHRARHRRVVVTFLDALFWSVPRLRYRTLWAPILAHGVSNTPGIVTFFLIGPNDGLW